MATVCLFIFLWYLRNLFTCLLAYSTGHQLVFKDRTTKTNLQSIRPSCKNVYRFLADLHFLQDPIELVLAD